MALVFLCMLISLSRIPTRLIHVGINERMSFFLTISSQVSLVIYLAAKTPQIYSWVPRFKFSSSFLLLYILRSSSDGSNVGPCQPCGTCGSQSKPVSPALTTARVGGINQHTADPLSTVFQMNEYKLKNK